MHRAIVSVEGKEVVIAEGRSFKEVLKAAHKWLVEHPEVDPDSLELIEEVWYYPISIHALCLLELEQRVGPKAAQVPRGGDRS